MDEIIKQSTIINTLVRSDIPKAYGALSALITQGYKQFGKEYELVSDRLKTVRGGKKTSVTFSANQSLINEMKVRAYTYDTNFSDLISAIISLELDYINEGKANIDDLVAKHREELNLRVLQRHK